MTKTTNRAMAGRLVLGFEDPQDIGTRLPANALYYITDHLGQPRDQPPIFILAEATREDWAECIRDYGHETIGDACGFPYFYFVSVD